LNQFKQSISDPVQMIQPP